MNKRKIIIFFLLIFSSFNCFSAVFVVTSNADSGPNTLRDALTQAAANGSTATDYINFNFSDVSPAGRTITLLSQLPHVSSNLIIDGTTQGGAQFGLSNARIALFYNTPVEQTLSGLSIINQSNVSIFGLYIKNITDVTHASKLYYWKGIDIEGGTNITIGQTGKGNVVTGFYFPLTTNWQIYNNNTSNLTIQNNIFSIDADGETLPVNTVANVVLQNIYGQITVGGTIAEGNLFASGLNTGKNNVFFGIGTANIVISNNKIGVDYTVKTSLAESYGLSMTNSNKGDVVTIEDNVVDNQLGKAAIDIDFIDKQVILLRNYVGIDKTGQVTLNTSPIGIYAHYSTEVQIGSDNTPDANFITGCKPVEIDHSMVSVTKNSFFCTVNEYPMYDSPDPNVPVVAITSITGSSVKGTATPNSVVELFYSDKCNTCSPQTYFESVNSFGNWSYNGTIGGSVIASATLNGYTSEFTITAIDSSKVKVTDACNGGLGSITGIVPYSAVNIKWVDKNGNTAGTASDLNAKPGIYKLIIGNGSCAASSAYYEIKNTFDADVSKVVTTEATCGNNDGSISGITVNNNVSGQTIYVWKDATGKQWGSALQLKNVPAGIYALSVSTADNSCTQILGPFQVKSSGAPAINETAEVRNPTVCGKSTGSITNIQVTGGTGNYQYIWWNSQQQIVGTTRDLTGQPAGVYQLEVTDGSNCGISYSAFIQIPEINGIVLDETQGITSSASCGLSNGAVTGIKAPGATNFKWVDATGKTFITPTPDLTKVPAGIYKLTATNIYGCSATSMLYTVTQAASVQYPVYPVAAIQPCAGQSNGSLSISTDFLVKSERWVNTADQTVFYGASITGLSAGTYQLYFTDNTGCENFYNTYILNPIPPLSIETPAEVTASTCGINNGSINDLQITGGTPPYTFTWTHGNDNPLPTNSNNLTNLLSGSYNLTVNDARCGKLSTSFIIPDNTIDIPAPTISNIQLCSSGSALLKVNNPISTAVYNLYSSPTGTQPIASQTGGQFEITITNNTSLYVSQVNGTCESSRTEVDVSVGISAINIANTFTPNGDNINDYWVIKNIENYPDALVQVFNRYGQKLFESRGYGKPFDGTYNGQKLPSGVYYYIINLSKNCNLLSGSLTIVR
jgi:gliding motility-associated-like protein